MLIGVSDSLKLSSFYRPVDQLLLGYFISIILLIILRSPAISTYNIELGFCIVSIFLIFMLLFINKRYKQRTIQFWVTFYPIALFIWLYPQACLLRHSFFTTDFDPLLLSIEKSVFILEWYQVLPSVLPEWVTEMFHGIYFSYYIGLVLFAIIAWKKRNPYVLEYVFVLSFTMIIHQWFLILFPASGPVPLREINIPDGLIFIPIMNWLYSTFDNGGGAFPSLHVAAAYVMMRYSIQFFPGKNLWFIVYFILISLSTVLCSFHYGVDVLVGAITGWISLQVGAKIYMYISKDESK